MESDQPSTNLASHADKPTDNPTEIPAGKAINEDTWLTLTKRLQALASTGIFFGESDFDVERYHEIQTIAKQMLADLGQSSPAVIDQLLINQGQGYETPKIDVRGAVFRGEEILLVREKLDRLWTLPGGYADVGMSPSQNIVKEIAEEANLEVSTTRLYALIHKARHAYDMDVRDFYKLFFLCDYDSGQEPKPGMETLDARFFPLDDLPPLSTGRVIQQDILRANEYRLNPNKPPVFD